MNTNIIIFLFLAVVIIYYFYSYMSKNKETTQKETRREVESYENNEDSKSNPWKNEKLVSPDNISSTFFQRDSSTSNKNKTRLINRDIHSCLVDKDTGINCVGDAATNFIVLTFKEKAYNVSKVKVFGSDKSKGFRYLMVSTFNEDDNPLSVSEDDFSSFAEEINEYTFEIKKTGVRKIIISDNVNALDISEIKIYAVDCDSPETPNMVCGQVSKPYIVPGELEDKTSNFKCVNNKESDFAKGPKYLVKLDDSKFAVFSDKGKLATLKLTDNKVYYGVANEGLLKVFFNYCLAKPTLRIYYDDGASSFASQTCTLEKYDISDYQVEDLDTLNIGNNFVEISWKVPKEPIVSYSLDYSVVNKPNRVTNRNNIEMNTYTDNNGNERISTKIIGLSPSTTYNFTIYAVNYNNTSSPNLIQVTTLA